MSSLNQVMLIGKLSRDPEVLKELKLLSIKSQEKKEDLPGSIEEDSAYDKATQQIREALGKHLNN